MNTQPVPTFPMVAGLEYLYGMTIDEMISSMSDEIDSDGYNQMESFILGTEFNAPDDWIIEEQHFLGNKNKLTLPFALECKKIGYDESSEIKTKIYARYLLFTHLV